MFLVSEAVANWSGIGPMSTVSQNSAEDGEGGGKKKRIAQFS